MNRIACLPRIVLGTHPPRQIVIYALVGAQKYPMYSHVCGFSKSPQTLAAVESVVS